MDAPPPLPGTYAARAAYFGDRVCPFCDHHNPTVAKFCNDCGSPLHLKPCNQCDAINLQAATNCYKCGAEYPALFTTPAAMPVLPAADPTPAWATGDVGVTATVTEPLFAGSALQAGWRLFRPAQFLLAAIATILIAGAYAAYRINAAMPDAVGVAAQPIVADGHNAPTAAPAVPMAVESKPVEFETAAVLAAPIPTTNAEAPKRASARQRPLPVPAVKRASASQRPAPVLQASVGATPPVAQSPAPASVNASVAEISEARQPNRWQAMHVSLAHCSGDLITRIVCDQRVRRRFCEGHWGEAPECASRVNDRGQ